MYISSAPSVAGVLEASVPGVPPRLVFFHYQHLATLYLRPSCLKQIFIYLSSLKWQVPT